MSSHRWKMHVATSAFSCGLLDDVAVDPPRGSIPAVMVEREGEEPVDGDPTLVRVRNDVANRNVLVSYLFFPFVFLSDSVRRNVLAAVGTLGEIIVPDHLAWASVWVIILGFVPVGVRISCYSVHHGLDRKVEQVGGDGSRSRERVAGISLRVTVGSGGKRGVRCGWVGR